MRKGFALVIALMMGFFVPQGAVAEENDLFSKAKNTFQDIAAYTESFVSGTPDQRVSEAANELLKATENLNTRIEQIAVAVTDLSSGKSCLESSTNIYSALAVEYKKLAILVQKDGKLAQAINELLMFSTSRAEYYSEDAKTDHLTADEKLKLRQEWLKRVKAQTSMKSQLSSSELEIKGMTKHALNSGLKSQDFCLLNNAKAVEDEILSVLNATRDLIPRLNGFAQNFTNT